MNRKILFVFIALFICLALNISASFAQESETVEYSLGKVSSVSLDSIMLKEYDYANEAEKEVAYSISPETSLVNAEEMSDIAIGDEVEIEYVVSEGNRVAKMITLDKASIQEEDISLEMPVEESPVSVEVTEDIKE